MTDYNYTLNITENDEIEGVKVVFRRTMSPAQMFAVSQKLNELNDPGIDGLINPMTNTQVLEHLQAIDINKAIRDYSASIIRAALDNHGWNVKQTAKFLTLKRTTLTETIKRLGIER